MSALQPSSDQQWHAELSQKLCDSGLTESQCSTHVPGQYVVYSASAYGLNGARAAETSSKYGQMLMSKYVDLTNKLIQGDYLLAERTVSAGSFKLLSLED